MQSFFEPLSQRKKLGIGREKPRLPEGERSLARLRVA